MFDRKIALRPIELVILLAAITVAVMLIRRGVSDPPQAGGATTIAFDSTNTLQRVVLVYIGDADCGACSNEDFKDALEALLAGMRSHVEGMGIAFYSIGTIMTKDIERAFEYFSDHGQWDELSIGGGWFNSLVEQHVWNYNRPALTPQIVVFKQEVARGPGLPASLLFSLVDRPIVVQGSAEIGAIVEQEDWSRLVPELGSS